MNSGAVFTAPAALGAPTSAPASADGAMPQLDALRAFAVGAVLVQHYAPLAQLPAPFDLSWGFLGVRLFFVLSGFLITGILIRARDDAQAGGVPGFAVLRAFYARRALRIFPLYYLVIAVCLLLNVPPVRDEWPWLVTYTYNLHVAARGWFSDNIAHFWSLAVEQQFYLLWPVVILFAPRAHLLKAAIGMVALGIAYRLLAIGFEHNSVAPYVFTVASFDSLGAGCLLALLSGGRSPSRALVSRLTVTALPAAACALILLQWLHDKSVAGPSMHVVLFDTGVALLFAWLVAAAARGFEGRAGRLLESAPLLYCGRIAYGIYVFHLLLLPALRVIVAPFGLAPGPAQAVQLLIGTLASIALAALSWHLLEQPINNLKNNFPYAPRAVRHVCA